MRWVAVVLAAVLVLAAGMGDAQAPPVKLALVIGNADYDGDGRIDASAAGVASSESRGFVQDLRNPLNDAADIQDALTRIGFRVDRVSNADAAAMSSALAAFGTKVAAAPDTAQIVVYYAGHAIQVDGANFLIPVKAQLPATDFSTMPTSQVQTVLRRVAVSTTEITEQLKQLRAPGVNLLMFDACRNNPWETRVRGLGRSVSATRGLAEIAAPPRTVIAFSTAPGRTADDGVGRNSPFAGVLKSWIARPGTVLQMLDSVGGEVQTATGGRQTPWFQSASVGQVCLARCASSQEVSDQRLLGNILPNDGRPWHQRLAAGASSVGTPRYGVSLQMMETRDAADFLAAIDTASVGAMREDAQRGDAFAQVIYGWVLITGKAGAPNVGEALQMFGRAAASGHPAGLESYGNLLISGALGPSRAQQGLEFLDQSLQQGWASAAFSLADIHTDGAQVPADHAKAAQYLALAADRGHIYAMALYANALVKGNGVPQNGPLALQWYQRAAVAGNPDGAYGVGRMLARGEAGVPADFAKARVVLEQSYRERNFDSALELGRLYELGLGVPRDADRALQLYRDAARSAREPAIRAEASRAAERLSSNPGSSPPLIQPRQLQPQSTVRPPVRGETTAVPITWEAFSELGLFARSSAFNLVEYNTEPHGRLATLIGKRVQIAGVVRQRRWGMDSRAFLIGKAASTRVPRQDSIMPSSEVAAVFMREGASAPQGSVTLSGYLSVYRVSRGGIVVEISDAVAENRRP